MKIDVNTLGRLKLEKIEFVKGKTTHQDNSNGNQNTPTDELGRNYAKCNAPVASSGFDLDVGQHVKRKQQKKKEIKRRRSCQQKATWERELILVMTQRLN